MGVLNPSDIILAGTAFGRVRAMIDEVGGKVLKAGPSIPVEVIGLSGVPNAGEEFIVLNDEKKSQRSCTI